MYFVLLKRGTCELLHPVSFAFLTTAHLLSARHTAPFIFTGDAARSDIQLAMPITQKRNH